MWKRDRINNILLTRLCPNAFLKRFPFSPLYSTSIPSYKFSMEFCNLSKVEVNLSTNSYYLDDTGFDDKFDLARMYAVRDRMKNYETQYSPVIELTKNSPFMIRLDGHCFRTFTKDFKKPFDYRIYSAMLQTASDMILYLNCSTAYTESDEISLIFTKPISPTATGEQNSLSNLFGGKLNKIITLTAGYASARFNFHLAKLAEQESEHQLADKMVSGTAHFDARLFTLPGEDECLSNILWRMFDCRRNSISNMCQSLFTQKAIDGLNGKQVTSNSRPLS